MDRPAKARRNVEEKCPQARAELRRALGLLKLPRSGEDACIEMCLPAIREYALSCLRARATAGVLKRILETEVIPQIIEEIRPDQSLNALRNVTDDEMPPDLPESNKGIATDLEGTVWVRDAGADDPADWRLVTPEDKIPVKRIPGGEWVAEVPRAAGAEDRDRWRLATPEEIPVEYLPHGVWEEEVPSPAKFLLRLPRHNEKVRLFLQGALVSELARIMQLPQRPNLNAEINAYMREHGLTIEQVAKHVGVSKSRLKSMKTSKGQKRYSDEEYERVKTALCK
jgi:hypothetical protein